jgi:hypothetical protein
MARPPLVPVRADAWLGSSILVPGSCRSPDDVTRHAAASRVPDRVDRIFLNVVPECPGLFFDAALIRRGGQAVGRNSAARCAVLFEPQRHARAIARGRTEAHERLLPVRLVERDELVGEFVTEERSREGGIGVLPVSRRRRAGYQAFQSVLRRRPDRRVGASSVHRGIRGRSERPLVSTLAVVWSPGK